MANPKQVETLTSQKVSTQIYTKVDKIIYLITFTTVATSFFAAAVILSSINLAK